MTANLPLSASIWAEHLQMSAGTADLSSLSLRLSPPVYRSKVLSWISTLSPQEEAACSFGRTGCSKLAQKYVRPDNQNGLPG